MYLDVCAFIRTSVYMYISMHVIFNMKSCMYIYRYMWSTFVPRFVKNRAPLVRGDIISIKKSQTAIYPTA
jgi:hypothetical protein